MPTGIYTRTKEHGRKISKSEKGKVVPIESRKKMSESAKKRGIVPPSQLGRKRTLETRKRLSEALPRGKQNHFWRGGVTPINAAVRSSFEYTLWREAVFKRDSWTCVWCGKRGGALNADHIKPFALYPELRFALDNGRTLCVPCHMTTDSYLKNNKR